MKKKFFLNTSISPFFAWGRVYFYVNNVILIVFFVGFCLRFYVSFTQRNPFLLKKQVSTPHTTHTATTTQQLLPFFLQKCTHLQPCFFLTPSLSVFNPSCPHLWERSTQLLVLGLPRAHSLDDQPTQLGHQRPQKQLEFPSRHRPCSPLLQYPAPRDR